MSGSCSSGWLRALSYAAQRGVRSGAQESVVLEVGTLFREVNDAGTTDAITRDVTEWQVREDGFTSPMVI